MSISRADAKNIAIKVALLTVGTMGLMAILPRVISLLGSVSTSKQKKMLIERLNRPELASVDFDKYEVQLFDSIVANHEVDVSFDDVGGMDDVVETIVDNVIIPIQAYKQLKMAGKMASCPTGILLC
jgi:ATP-dependent 26S proteasome regulatory subunit